MYEKLVFALWRGHDMILCLTSSLFKQSTEHIYTSCIQGKHTLSTHMQTKYTHTLTF